MKILQINSVYQEGSTGRICDGINKLVNAEDDMQGEVIYFWGKAKKEGVKLSFLGYEKIQALKSRVLGNYGMNSPINTIRTISYIKKYSPDIIHLHNIHDHTINVVMLLKYLKKKKINIVWTFHDCWTFTAYCAHFTMVKCEKWKTECYDCPIRKKYSWFFDCSKMLYKRKKAAFKDLKLTIVTPSQWLAGLVKESYLKDYPVHVINNGIDLDVFRPTKSDFKARYGIEEGIPIVLFVSYAWDERKGLDVVISLESMLGDNFQIIIVGTNDEIDKVLPSNIISIHRTQSQKELAEIYTVADVFANPTREEVLGMVNLEALACGTPVVTFNTGGSPECIDKTCGIIVDDFGTKESAIAMCDAVRYVCMDKPFTEWDCIRRAQKFNIDSKYQEYINLYIVENEKKY